MKQLFFFIADKSHCPQSSPINIGSNEQVQVYKVGMTTYCRNKP